MSKNKRLNGWDQVVQIEKKLFQIGYVKMLSQPKELEKQNSQSIDEERERLQEVLNKYKS